ncbi:hypothetical protein OAS86_06640 [Gammaproteobacteria bacterium]|nr:hypothetical protein [Gammaproteobacteria bacterium]
MDRDYSHMLMDKDQAASPPDNDAPAEPDEQSSPPVDRAQRSDFAFAAQRGENSQRDQLPERGDGQGMGDGQGTQFNPQTTGNYPVEESATVPEGWEMHDSRGGVVFSGANGVDVMILDNGDVELMQGNQEIELNQDTIDLIPPSVLEAAGLDEAAERIRSEQQEAERQQQAEREEEQRQQQRQEDQRRDRATQRGRDNSGPDFSS